MVRWPRRARAIVGDLPAELHRQFRHSDTHFTYDVSTITFSFESQFFTSISFLLEILQGLREVQMLLYFTLAVIVQLTPVFFSLREKNTVIR